jgi:1,4-alpha-glucan branching enzyme
MRRTFLFGGSAAFTALFAWLGGCDSAGELGAVGAGGSGGAASATSSTSSTGSTSSGTSTSSSSGGGGNGAGGSGGGGPAITPLYLGANVEPGGVVFRVWAPNATAASVRGEVAAMDVPMSAAANAKGVFEAHVAGAHPGQAYSFVLETPDGELVRKDPYCRELTQTGCVVVDPTAYAWKTGGFKQAPRNRAVVYEMHIGSFAVPAGSDHGTYASTRAALPELAKLGVNVIEVMPVQESGNDPLGWGYNPQLFLAPKAVLGTLDEFRALVDDAHALGIAVWVDTVENHTDGWNKAPLHCFDGCQGANGIYFFPPGQYASTPWGPRPDYTRAEVKNYLLDSIDVWMGENRCDGFRFDSVSNIRGLDGNGDTPGGKDLLTASNDRVHARGGLSVAEDLKGWDKITNATNNGGFGFDAQWDGFGWSVMDTMALFADDARDLGKIQGAVSGTYSGDGYARLLFTEDHDTVGNGGSRLPDRIDSANPTSWAARKRSMLGAALLFTSPGVPMIFQGQESLATGTFDGHPKPLAAPTAEGLKVQAFYRDLIHLRTNAAGGAGGLSDANVEVFHRNDAAKVLAYRRHGASGEDVIVVVNLRKKDYTQYDVGVDSAGPWKVRLNTESTAYGSDFNAGQTGSITAQAQQKDGKAFSLPLKLGAYAAMILTK